MIITISLQSLTNKMPTIYVPIIVVFVNAVDKIISDDTKLSVGKLPKFDSYYIDHQH